MKTIQTRIEERVEAFVVDLQQLVRDAAIDAIDRALVDKKRPMAQRRVSTRRAPEEPAELTEALYEAVCATPGASMRVLSESVERGCRELALPVRRLMRDGRVKKTGQRDQTRYFPVGPEAKPSRRRRAR